jgi:hypothetical protein
MTAMQEFVVPKSMPITFAIYSPDNKNPPVHKQQVCQHLRRGLYGYLVGIYIKTCRAHVLKPPIIERQSGALASNSAHLSHLDGEGNGELKSHALQRANNHQGHEKAIFAPEG